MPDFLEPVIQTDALEPTLYDVMDQLIALHDRADASDDRIDSLREHMDEKFASADQKLDSLGQQAGGIQVTLTEVVKHFKAKGG